MKWVQIILADLIRRGRVTVDIPGLDMDELRRALHGKADQTLCAVMNVAFDDEQTDREKVIEIQNILLH